MQMPIITVWLTNNLVGRPARAVGAAIIYGFGNSANLVSSNVFIASQAPRYPVGFGVGLALMVMGGLATITMVLLLKRENKLLDKRAESTLELETTQGKFRNTL